MLDLLVNTTDPNKLDESLENLGANLVLNGQSYKKVGESYVLRCYKNVNFVKRAINILNLGTVVDEKAVN